jgi:hypothetical protein
VFLISPLRASPESRVMMPTRGRMGHYSLTRTAL